MRVHFKVKPRCSLESREASFILDLASGTVLSIPTRCDRQGGTGLDDALACSHDHTRRFRGPAPPRRGTRGGGDSPGEARGDAPIARLAEEVRRYGWLVFSARSERGVWDLFECGPHEPDRRNLTRTPGSNEAAAQFSRDGRRLLFYRLPGGEPIDGNHYGAQGHSSAREAKYP
jgi:hypothetical protein